MIVGTGGVVGLAIRAGAAVIIGGPELLGALGSPLDRSAFGPALLGALALALALPLLLSLWVRARLCRAGSDGPFGDEGSAGSHRFGGFGQVLSGQSVGAEGQPDRDDQADDSVEGADGQPLHAASLRRGWLTGGKGRGEQDVHAGSVTDLGVNGHGAVPAFR